MACGSGDRASLGDEITDKTTAEAERDRLRAAIRAGEFVKPATPRRNTLTLVQLMEVYRKQHIAVHRADTLKTTYYAIAAIMGTELVRADDEKRYFGAWLVTDITTDVIEQDPGPVAVGGHRHQSAPRSLDPKKYECLSQVFQAASLTSSRKLASAASRRSKARWARADADGLQRAGGAKRPGVEARVEHGDLGAGLR